MHFIVGYQRCKRIEQRAGRVLASYQIGYRSIFQTGSFVQKSISIRNPDTIETSRNSKFGVLPSKRRSDANRIVASDVKRRRQACKLEVAI